MVELDGDEASARLTPWFGWLLSASCHLTLALVIALLLVPAGNQTSNLIELMATFDNGETEIAELEVVEISSPTDGEIAPPDDLGADELTDDASIELFETASQGAIGQAIGPDGSSAAQSGQRSGGEGAGTQFFGTKAYGNRFVYVLDISGSMSNDGGDSASVGSRYRRAADELIRSVNQLNADQQFYVVLFASHTRMMFDEQSAVPQLIAATRDNKQRLKDWLDEVRPGGGTDPREALRVGLELYPSAVFMLSDGEFRIKRNMKLGGMLSGENVDVPQVVERCNLALAPIHTVAFEDQSNRRNMSDLSAQTGGEYRFVPPLGAVDAAPNRSAANIKPAVQFVPLADRESRAANVLSLAKSLLDQGKPEPALRWFKRVIEQYPGTAAAKAAQEMIDSLQSPAQPGGSLPSLTAN